MDIGADLLDHEERDELTGFYLRKALMPFLKFVGGHTEQKKGRFSVVLIDIDKFKKFNDKFSHSFGDMILKYVASTLSLSLHQDEHYIFRYGGDEFIVVFPNKDQQDAFKSMHRCVKVLVSRPFVYGYNLFRITVSCGIASFPRDTTNIYELLEKADKAMYFSKKHGHGLITNIGSIPYIVTRNFFSVIIGVAILYFLLDATYPKYVRQYVNWIKEKITGYKIVSSSGEYAVLVMNNGRVMEGEIVEETDARIVLKMRVESGTVDGTFNKSDIREIKRKGK